VRIIAGQYRRRELISPPATTRPMRDRVREAVFSMLEHVMDFESRRVLDLFAGSGSLGFESLSRGAQRCTFVEQNHHAIDTIRQNAARLGVTEIVGIEKCAVATFLKLRSQAAVVSNLVFLDPPFADDVQDVLLAMFRSQCVQPGAILVLHTDRRKDDCLSNHPFVGPSKNLEDKSARIADGIKNNNYGSSDNLERPHNGDNERHEDLPLPLDLIRQKSYGRSLISIFEVGS